MLQLPTKVQAETPRRRPQEKETPVEQTQEKRSAGPPTKYRPEYCRKLIEFFSVPLFTEKERTYTTKNGTVKTETYNVPNQLPMFEVFAHTVANVSRVTLWRWSEAYPEFAAAWERAQELQKNFLIQNGISGLYNPVFTQFVAKNITDMKDRQEVTGADGGAIAFTVLPPSPESMGAWEEFYEKVQAGKRPPQIQAIDVEVVETT
jgi:hypothetical protein